MIYFLKKISLLILPVVACFFVYSSLASAAEIKGLAVEPQIKAIFLNWNKIALEETESVVVIRKEGECPQSAYDGKEVYRGNGMSFLDKKISESTKYCYGVYVYNSLGSSAILNKSGLVETVSFWQYMGAFFQQNYFLAGGIIIIIMLNLLNIRKKRKFYRNS
jgi:hypothetical protein